MPLLSVLLTKKTWPFSSNQNRTYRRLLRDFYSSKPIDFNEQKVIFRTQLLPSARKTSSGLHHTYFRDSTNFCHHQNLLRDSRFFHQPNQHFPQSTFTSGLHLGQKNKLIHLDIRAQFEQLSTSKNLPIWATSIPSHEFRAKLDSSFAKEHRHTQNKYSLFTVWTHNRTGRSRPTLLGPSVSTWSQRDLRDPLERSKSSVMKTHCIQ